MDKQVTEGDGVTDGHIISTQGGSDEVERATNEIYGQLIWLVAPLALALGWFLFR